MTAQIASKPEQPIRRLIERHQVARVAITTGDGRSFFAAAYPASHHPIVERRRRDAFAGQQSLSIAEVTTITEQTVHEPLARVHGSTIYAALAALESAIRELSA